jgi:Sugar-transfer associated ATP-grasp
MAGPERAPAGVGIPQQSKRSYGRLGDAIRRADLQLYQTVRAGYQWALHERRTDTRLPLARKLALWRRGFFAESGLIYDLPSNDYKDYLSDFQQLLRCGRINAWEGLYNRKLGLRAMLRARGFRQPETFAYIHERRALTDPFSADARYVSLEDLEQRLVRDSGLCFILNPEGEGRKEHAAVVVSRGGVLHQLLAGSERQFDLSQYLSALDTRAALDRQEPCGVLVERRLDQGGFWRDLFPESLNTIRLLTLWSPADAQPFVARAVQRVGTRETSPTDSWSSGGISALIDLEAGRLGQGKTRLLVSEGTPHLLTNHPETGSPIAGTHLPGWHRLVDVILRAAASMPFSRMVNWDVMVDTEGVPVILDATGNAEVISLQIHGGFFAEPRLRRFYEAFGVVEPASHQSSSPRAMGQSQEAEFG